MVVSSFVDEASMNSASGLMSLSGDEDVEPWMSEPVVWLYVQEPVAR